MPDRTKLALLAAAMTAALTVAAAVVSVSYALAVDGRPATTHIPGTTDAAPGIAWTLDAPTLLDHKYAAFRNPTVPTHFDSGEAGFTDFGDVFVTMAGLPNHRSGNFDRATMIGVDAEDGSVLWRADAGSIGGCSERPAAGKFVCYSSSFEDDQMFVTFDLNDGEVTRTPTEWDIFGLDTFEDRVYTIEGNVEDNDVRVHAGTVDDPDAYWSKAFDIGAGWEEIAFGKTITTKNGAGLIDLGRAAAGFELESGTQTWTAGYPDCSEDVTFAGDLLQRVRRDCDDYSVKGVDLLDPSGEVVISTQQRFTQSLEEAEPTDDSVPIIVGDSGFDRRTGEKLWTSSLLVSDPDGDNPNGTAFAMFGDVVLVRDPQNQSVSGIDARTGNRLWTQEVRSSDGYAFDGRNVVAFDDLLRATDIRTGEQAWEIPVDAMVESDRDSPRILRETDQSLIYATNATLISLR
ncbi:PQQ-binding-like beta-propeller repeat protein [Antrihabitans sp. YC3-6]|uniref:PQQ-binding-like beta-propeller repeat protein n=1 Tax=Antrihabitans stalagmiti TaxID=2799499 RepID=A0A934NT89_9NOCA|nr:PQQ-binding-like beta-propeller repeat protein [Antrihabitans stalagmiti]MBJ8341066.1 PQQ-binding-like beta-propeller repeat protein [Antrihabitans stalagmiti]